MDFLDGIVESVVYNAGAYYIVHMSVQGQKYEKRSAKGNLFGIRHISPGVPLRLKGSWVNNQKYGRQFQIKGWDLLPAGNGYLKTFLSVCVEGFDFFTAEHVVDKYGADTYSALQNPAKVLEDVSAANPTDLKAALVGWERMLAVRALADVLKDGGLGSSEIDAAVRRFGSEAPTIVRENPFRLMEIPGFDFGKVDKLSVLLGIPRDHPCRLEGAALWALHAGTREGHLYLQRGDVSRYALDVRGATDPLPVLDEPGRGFRTAINALIERKSVISEEGVGVYLKDYYHYERVSAQKLARLLTPSALQVDFDPFLEEFERNSSLNLSDAQKEAVRQLINHKVLTLTGLPGTGKTTAVKAIVRLFEVTRTPFCLMAPTGIAAKRLSQVTGYPASTIHRGLGYDGSAWAHGAHNKVITSAVIVDEMSMVDQELFFRLLDALRDDTMLVLVGDDAQLPSVGPGNVLKELVACKDIPSVRLTQIFRQSAESDIVTNSHRINRGEYPTLGTPNGPSDFKYIRLTDEGKMLDLIVAMAAKLKARDANFQVLAPKYDGIVGVDSLNLALRDVLNPSGPPEWKGKFQHFRVGDRLMIIKNDYKKGVYNGDVGKLLYITDRKLLVRVYGASNGMDMEVPFTEGEADEKLRLAYAITVHKSQGSEFDTTLLPVVNTQGRMLQRNLLYTAITRAKKTVWVIGEESAIRKAVENNQVVKRNTRLGDVISGVLLEPNVPAPETQERDQLREADGLLLN